MQTAGAASSQKNGPARERSPFFMDLSDLKKLLVSLSQTQFYFSNKSSIILFKTAVRFMISKGQCFKVTDSKKYH